MACVENIPPANGESEMEEGEIVDDVDDLSDISSEEEFLLRQGLQVLETYNDVLERKKAKRTPVQSGKKYNRESQILCNFSKLPSFEGHYTNKYKDRKYEKSFGKNSIRKETASHISTLQNKDYKKKRRSKKRAGVKVVSESSDDSDDEFRSKRKLALSVAVSKNCNNASFLTLKSMFSGLGQPEKEISSRSKLTKSGNLVKNENKLSIHGTDSQVPTANVKTEKKIVDNTNMPKQLLSINKSEVYDESTDDEKKNTTDVVKPQENVPLEIKVEQANTPDNPPDDKDSDEDLELLRQNALNTKSAKGKTTNAVIPESKAPLSDDEDSDTADLRLICLKSALIKKAIEMKRKQKMQKKRSQSYNLNDELMAEQEEMLKAMECENNTDIESVDMDIGSDADDRNKDMSNNCSKTTDDISEKVTDMRLVKEEEFEEDEDLLRAKLLTSLSKNLPNLVDHSIINNDFDLNEGLNNKIIEKDAESVQSSTTTEPDVKRLIINLRESDSEGEHEATKNLTKMHLKLSEQIDFQNKLDLFLKTTRMAVENNNTTESVQQKPVTPAKPKKFVAKALHNLPESEQIEYQNLVKRMEELERVKKARQASMNKVKKNVIKDTLKPHNVSDNSENMFAIKKLEDQIALSRKKIAEESASVLKLKEEGTKLSQKYKIVATELRNLATAINLNKKQQKFAQTRLSKARVQHQILLKSSSANHSKPFGIHPTITKPLTNGSFTNKLQKENNPSKEDTAKTNLLKAMRVSVVNDFNVDKKKPNSTESRNQMLSVQVDVSSNKKTIKLPNVTKDRRVDVDIEFPCSNIMKADSCIQSCNLKEKESRNTNLDKKDNAKEMDESFNYKPRLKTDAKDYISPLNALQKATWKEDPNAFLCPFEVGGNCKDPECNYIHPKLPADQ